MSIVASGEAAPDFRLMTEQSEPFGRSELLGTTTVLVFYPFAFSPVCSDQLSVYEEVLGEIHDRGAQIYGVSCDSTWSQRAFREKLGVSIGQLSDWEPKGAASRAFGVLHEAGFPQRALIIVGPDAVVRYAFQAPSPADLPGANLIFDGLDAVPAAH